MTDQEKLTEIITENSTVGKVYLTIGIKTELPVIVEQIMEYYASRKGYSLEEIKEKIYEALPCSCLNAYKDRNMVGPQCSQCNYAEEILCRFEIKDASRKDEGGKLVELLKTTKSHIKHTNNWNSIKEQLIKGFERG